MKLKVALAQLSIISENPERNLEKVEKVVQSACSAGCRMIVLPELWGSGYNLKNRENWATPRGKGLFREASRLAREYSIFLQAGSLLSVRSGNFFNTASMFDPSGKCLGYYDKIHQFRFMGEPKYLSPGIQPQVYTLPWCKAGQSICYDLRFPELYRYYAKRCCKILFVPAEWPVPRREHWRTLLRSRAIENQSFVIGVNRVGKYQDIRFFGSSAVVGPDGTVLVEGKSREDLLITEIDLNWVDQLRSTFPVLKDMKKDFL